MTITAPQPVETSTQSPLGAAVPITRRPFQPSPLNRRRWQYFKANRRGYWSFWIFLVLFMVSLFANFIANDRPLLVKYDGRLYWPVLFSYSETTFGGDFETTADYRDPYLQKQIAEKGGTVVWPLIRFSYDTHNLDLPTPAPSKPTWMLTEEQCKEVVQKKGLKSCRDLEYNWLGTDDQSRDVVARLIYGFRISVLFGLTLTILSSIIGIANGVIMFRHLLPNAMVATMTFLPFIVSSSVMTLTALDFLGFGLPPGSPSLGELLSQGKANVQAPWLGFTGFFSVAIMLSLLIFIGEAARDAFDPRKTFR